MGSEQKKREEAEQEAERRRSADEKEKREEAARQGNFLGNLVRGVGAGVGTAVGAAVGVVGGTGAVITGQGEFGKTFEKCVDGGASTGGAYVGCATGVVDSVLHLENRVGAGFDSGAQFASDNWCSDMGHITQGGGLSLTKKPASEIGQSDLVAAEQPEMFCAFVALEMLSTSDI